MRWLLLCYIWKKREIKKEKAKKAWNQHAILPTSSFGVNDDVRDEYNNVLQKTRPLFPTYAFAFPCFWVSCKFLLLILSVVEGLSQIWSDKQSDTKIITIRSVEQCGANVQFTLLLSRNVW